MRSVQNGLIVWRLHRQGAGEYFFLFLVFNFLPSASANRRDSALAPVWSDQILAFADRHRSTRNPLGKRLLVLPEAVG